MGLWHALVLESLSTAGNVLVWFGFRLRGVDACQVVHHNSVLRHVMGRSTACMQRGACACLLCQVVRTPALSRNSALHTCVQYVSGSALLSSVLAGLSVLVDRESAVNMCVPLPKRCINVIKPCDCCICIVLW
ncbi:hypothetical protein COO60DRAFT_1537607 [Scenedesmus sp. NREL 46B-D3]|nr:hypothetical protein COO60DRAFT_1537607 [Scenedesmus sp. NREL 46B-D3]